MSTPDPFTYALREVSLCADFSSIIPVDYFGVSRSETCAVRRVLPVGEGRRARLRGDLLWAERARPAPELWPSRLSRRSPTLPCGLAGAASPARL